MRKRATLMVMLVSLVFGICWVTDRTNYVIVHFYSPSDAFFSLAASNTLVLINSTINPIVYALVNHRFREKARMMLRRICCPISNTALPGADGPQVMALQQRRTGGIPEQHSRLPSITDNTQSSITEPPFYSIWGNPVLDSGYFYAVDSRYLVTEIWIPDSDLL